MSKFTSMLRSAGASVLALGLAGGGAALASGPVDPPYVPPVTIPQPDPQYDWSGFYGGLSFSGVTSRASSGGVSFNMPRQTGAGAFAGYNWQSGNMVFGGELTYTNFNGPYVPTLTNRQRDALELRARAGYAMDRVLAYGFVGAARSSVFGAGAWNPQNGYSFGLGVQAAVGRNMFIGVEAARRNVSATIGPANVRSVIDSLSLRAGFQF